LGHFSKMDKENECPKSKNATLSLFTVFYVGPEIVGHLVHSQLFMHYFVK
jgi:hypothetical protein